MATKSHQTPRATAGFESLGAMVTGAFQAQERALRVTQDFSESVLGTLNEQAANCSALLGSIDASLRAMERAIQSQADSTKALSESLEASRKVVDTAMTAQQQAVERVGTFVGSMLGLLDGQLDALRTQVGAATTMKSDPASSQSDVFLQVTQDWREAYDQLLNAAVAPFQRDDKG